MIVASSSIETEANGATVHRRNGETEAEQRNVLCTDSERVGLMDERYAHSRKQHMKRKLLV